MLTSWQSEHNKCKVHLSVNHMTFTFSVERLCDCGSMCCAEVPHESPLRLRHLMKEIKRWEQESRRITDMSYSLFSRYIDSLRGWGEFLTAGDKAVKVSDKFSFTSCSGMCWSIRCHYWLRYTRVPIVLCMSFVHSIQCICIIMQ